jgi:hypothetical protein
LARIYEDQGLFLRAREVIAKVLAHEPGNEAARRADAHLVALLAGEQSPSGESIIQLIKKVEAAAGLLEEDEVELWATAAAGVTEVLTGFETLTLARAVAAAAGLQGADEFICLSTDAPATWELELPPVPLTLGAAGAEEWDIILPFKVGGQYVTGLSVLDVTVPAAPGVVGTDEFELPARGRRPVNVEVDDFVLDLKAAVAAHRGAAPARAAPVITRAAPASSRRVETPPAPAPEPVIEPEPAPADELAVRPERYLEKRPSTLPEQTLKKDDDFLGWLDSIKLREI